MEQNYLVVISFTASLSAYLFFIFECQYLKMLVSFSLAEPRFHASVGAQRETISR